MAKTTKENIIIKKNSRYDRLRRTGQVLVASDRKEHTRWFIFFLSDVWNRYMFLSRRDMNENLMFRFFFSSFYVDTCVVTTPDARTLLFWHSAFHHRPSVHQSPKRGLSTSRQWEIISIPSSGLFTKLRQLTNQKQR